MSDPVTYDGLVTVVIAFSAGLVVGVVLSGISLRLHPSVNDLRNNGAA